jgi:hypothetical protein
MVRGARPLTSLSRIWALVAPCHGSPLVGYHLFPGRASEGYELLLMCIGGARDRGIADMIQEDMYRMPKSMLSITPFYARRTHRRVSVSVVKFGNSPFLRTVEGIWIFWQHWIKMKQNYPAFSWEATTGVIFGDCVQLDGPKRREWSIFGRSGPFLEDSTMDGEEPPAAPK